MLIRADDPIAPGELAAMAQERGWVFEAKGESLFFIAKTPPEWRKLAPIRIKSGSCNNPKLIGEY